MCSFVSYLVFGVFVYFACKELKGFSGKMLFRFFPIHLLPK